MNKDMFSDIFSKSKKEWDAFFANIFSELRGFIQKNAELSTFIGMALGFLIAQSVSLFLSMGAIILIFIFVLWSIAPEGQDGE